MEAAPPAEKSADEALWRFFRVGRNFMKNENSNSLYRIFPEILYAVDRNATPSWYLDDVMTNHNIMLIYGGRGEFTCNGVKRTAQAGSLLYFQPGERRTAQTDPNQPLKAYALDFQYLCPIYSKGQWTPAAPPLPFPFFQILSDEYLFSRLTYFFGRLTKSRLSAVDRYGNRERALVTEILVLLFRYAEGNRYRFSSVHTVENVINYMAEHFAEDLPSSTLAEYAGLSESYLGRIFKLVTGQAPIDYLIDIRVNKAKDMLQDGATVSDTARMTGFHDVYYFSRAFKKKEGISPSVYKKIPM